MLRLSILALGFLSATCAGSPSTPGDDGQTPGPNPGVVVQDGIEYSGDVLVMESFPVQIRGNVTITNRSGETRRVWFPDGCVALLRAYREGGATPVWDQGSEMGCTMAIVEVTLAPGESHEVGTPTSSAADVLGDGQPDGRYRITIYLRPENGAVEVDGGTTELAIPR